MRKVDIYTDGSYSRIDKTGGYGAVIIYKGSNNNGTRDEIRGSFNGTTTNNRMELEAVIVSLAFLDKPSRVQIYSDSKYVVDTVNKGWLNEWKSNNWIKKNKKPALNIDMWERLLPLLELHKVNFIWIKGHSGNEENERSDELAKSSILDIRKE